MDIITPVHIFNQDILQIGNRPLAMLSEKEREFMDKALREEITEFLTAHGQGDMIGCIDAMIDNIYFAIGGLCRMGLTPDMIFKCFMAVHWANMNKKKGQVAGRSDDGTADAVKPAGWKPPEEAIGEILDQATK